MLSAPQGTSRSRERSRRARLARCLISQVRAVDRNSLRAPLTPYPSFADAIVTDSRGFHLPKGKSHEVPLSEKLRLQLAWDVRVFELDRFLKPPAVPSDVIDSFDAQVEREGWQKCVLDLFAQTAQLALTTAATQGKGGFGAPHSWLIRRGFHQSGPAASRCVELPAPLPWPPRIDGDDC